MSSDPSPAQYFSHCYFIYKTATSDQFTIGRYGGITKNFVVRDTPDAGKTDDTTQIGDVQNDVFTAGVVDGSSAPRTYFGQTSQQGLIGTAKGKKGTIYFLYTNNTYDPGATVQVDHAAYPLCFVTGTRIRTARGDVPVEMLAVGDRAVTASGALRPVIWIGKRTLDGPALSRDQAPVRHRRTSSPTSSCP
ncbi:conserved hypothetical protein [Methylobacterium sp. 4-46]|uniref:Hint domain-containing protein n=1 Tax=unclassified Methylobacterium TaxID=2615210 RepID=UPI000152E7E0|nr:Hint domain-containing protein [Methylobacterium sp. 4-46]ACA15803.1 conserved hypothetical protein [Methylobacterium sp. 4-46]